MKRITREDLKTQWQEDEPTLSYEAFLEDKFIILHSNYNGPPQAQSPTEVNTSWLDHHTLNENSEIDGIIIKHHDATAVYGGVAVKTLLGNFALVTEDQEKAAKNKGERVLVKPHKDYYGTVMIINYL